MSTLLFRVVVRGVDVGERREEEEYPPTHVFGNNVSVVFPSLCKKQTQKKTSREEEEEEEKKRNFCVREEDSLKKKGRKKPQDKKREREKEERKKEVQNQHDTKNHHHQYTMGISRDSLHKRRATGGKLKPWRKARKYVSF